jgi:hypothetical protein
MLAEYPQFSIVVHLQRERHMYVTAEPWIVTGGKKLEVVPTSAGAGCEVLTLLPWGFFHAKSSKAVMDTTTRQVLYKGIACYFGGIRCQ